MRKIVILTGMSGAGKTSALDAFEDMGYETVDNLPLSLFKDFINTKNQKGLFDEEKHSPLAICIDIRTRDFCVDLIRQITEFLANEEKTESKLLFIDCDNEVLRRRYTETRRSHPLSQDKILIDCINAEKEIMQPLKELADIIIDSSELATKDLKRIIKGKLPCEENSQLNVFVTSFSYRKGIPREADIVFDVRFLKNPYYEVKLRHLTGKDKKIGDFIKKDSGYNQFFNNLISLLEPLFPRYKTEGKSYLTIAIGCTGGKHRSVYISEQLTLWMKKNGHRVNIRHRELEK